MADPQTQFQQANGGTAAFQFMNGQGYNSQGQVVQAPAQSQSPWIIPPVQKPEQQQPPAGTGSAIVSSMVGPAYQNFQASINQANKENDNTQTTTIASANANNASAQASIAAQVFGGNLQLSHQADAIVKQAQGISNSLTATLAANSPSGGFGSTAAADYQNKINQGTNQSLSMIEQAKQLLSLQGTADEQAANATAAGQIMTAAQNHMNNVLTLSQQSFTASTQVATAELQGAQYDQQQQQMDLQVKEYHDQQSQQALNFTSQNNITSPFFTSGGTTYDSKTLSPVSSDQLQKLGVDPTDKSQVSAIPDQATRQLLTNFSNAYGDAGIDPTKDTIASAQKKIQSSKIYNAAVNSGFGTSAVAKPVGQLLTVQQSSGMLAPQFNYVTNLVQGYLSQHPQLWNLNTADPSQVAQSEQEVLGELQNDPRLRGYTYNQIWPIVSYMFSPDPNAWIQSYKTSTGTSNYDIGQGGGSGTIPVIGSGANNGAININQNSGSSPAVLPVIPNIGG